MSSEPNNAAADATQATANIKPPKKKLKIPRFVWIMLGIGVFFVVAIVLGGHKQTQTSDPGRAPVVQSGDPTKTPDLLAQTIKDRDANLADRALKSPGFLANGGSVQPHLTREFNDPLDEYSKDVSGGAAAGNAPSALPASVGAQPASYGVPPPPPRQQDQNLVNAMTKLASGADEFKVATAERIDTQSKEGGAGSASSGAVAAGSTPRSTDGNTAPGAASSSSAEGKSVFVRTGHLLYAAMDLEANSDSANFVQATVQAGPFRGARLQGTFKKTKNDDLEVVFSTLSWRNGTYHVNSLAVNPEEPKVGLVSEVNHHYITRFGGLFLTGVFSAVGQQLAQQGTTTSISTTTGLTQTTVPTKTPLQYGLIGLGGVAQGFSQIAAEGARREPTVVVSARTPVGVLFKEDWVDNPTANLPNATIDAPAPAGDLPYLPTGSPTQATAALDGNTAP